MKRMIWFLAVVAGTFASAGLCRAQDEKLELTGDYSYFRFNPGLPSLFNSQNLNGGGGQGAFYFTEHLGVVADFQGYGSSTVCTKPSAPISGCASGTLFTYLFGPQVKARMGKLEPFGEVLVGGAHSGFYGSACNNISGACGVRSPSNNAFAFVVGGGADFAVTEKIAIRIVDADYELTRFGNNFTNGNNSQSNFRLQTGIQVRF